MTIMRRHRFHLLPALALLLPVALPAQQHFPATADLETMARYLVEDGETPGIALGFLEADGSTRLVFHGSGGPDTRPLGPRSVFEIGSINKTFTGVLLADMVLRGEVALEDPVAKYLPDHVTVPSRNGREITLLDLATHTSGLPRLPGNHRPADMADPYADYTIETMYDFLSSHTLRRDPGAEGEYSNLGFGLLGHALARAAGSSYVELVRERILRPLGMTMTGWELEGELAAWHTRGHRGGEVVPYWFGTEAIHGAGSLRSNMEDMLKYLEANVAPPTTALHRAMRFAQEPRRPLEDEEGWHMGLGWQVQSYEGRTLVMHGGGTGGYATHLALEPATGIGTVLLTNTTGFGDDLDRDFLRRGPPLPVAGLDLPRATLARYVGAYQIEAGQTMHIRLDDDALTLQVPGNVRFRLHADSETEFVTRRAPWRVSFERDASGQVAGLTFTVGGQAREARKVSDASPPPAVVAGNAVLDETLTRAEMEPYVGSYTLALGARTLGVRLFIEDGALHVHPEGQGVSALLSQGEHTFALQADNAIRLIFDVEDGVATGVTLLQAGQRVQGTRNP